MIRIRPADSDDHAPLARIDLLIWSADTSPAPPPDPARPFFHEGRRPEDVLVAEVSGDVAGFVALSQPVPLPSHRHALLVRGPAVDPSQQRKGIGRRLLEEAVEEARRRGARKLSLRVLAPNHAARRLFVTCGFVIEGVLREEFAVDGRYVDDVLMARRLDEDRGRRRR